MTILAYIGMACAFALGWRLRANWGPLVADDPHDAADAQRQLRVYRRNGEEAD